MYDCNVYCSAEWLEWNGHAEHMQALTHRLIEGAIRSLPPNAAGIYLVRVRSDEHDAMDYAIRVDLTNHTIGVCWWDEIPVNQQQNYIRVGIDIARADA